MGLIKTAMIAGAGIYAVNKLTKTSNTSPAASQDGKSRQQDFDAPPSYYPGPYQAGQSQRQWQEYQPQEKVVPLEFTARRSQSQGQQPQQQHGQAQVLLTNNSASSPLPHGYNHQAAYDYDSDVRTEPEPANMYAGSAPPSLYDNGRPRRQQGFVEPDEVSDATFDGPSRRGNTGGTGLINTLARQAANVRDGKGKDLIGRLLSR